jgi:hypothetical protein
VWRIRSSSHGFASTSFAFAAIIGGMSDTQARKPKGTPTGGQFAAKSQPESTVAVEPSWPGLTRKIETSGSVRAETWVDESGNLQDPPDGSPARRRLRADGTVKSEEHYQDGPLQDPPDGSPAERQFYPDGTIEYEGHWQAGHLQDSPDGSPAVRSFYPDGTVKSEEHWQDGRRVS